MLLLFLNRFIRGIYVPPTIVPRQLTLPARNQYLTLNDRASTLHLETRSLDLTVEDR
jgi:hypothetical protein